MSPPKPKERRIEVVSKDGSVLDDAFEFKVAGMVRTIRKGEKHYAVALVTISKSGDVKIELGGSQVVPFGKAFVAKEHARISSGLAAVLW